MAYSCTFLIHLAAVAVFTSLVSANDCQSLGFSLSDCFCNATLINCTNAGLTDLVGLKKILNNLSQVERIVITGNSFHELPANLFGTCQWPSHPLLPKLTEIDFSHNEIETIYETAFNCAPYVESLDLSGNKWYVYPNNGRVFSNLRKLKILLMKNATSVSNPINGTKRVVNLQHVFSESNMQNLEELHLENNPGIVNFDSNMFGGKLLKLKTLYLSHNSIGNINFNVESVPILTELHLDDNTIMYLGPNTTQELEKLYSSGSLNYVNLTLNPFKCDCLGEMPHFLQWVQSERSNMLVDKSKMTCSADGPGNLRNVSLLNITEDDLKIVCNIYKNHHSKAVVAVMAIIFTVLGIGFIVVIYLNRVSLRKKCGTYNLRELSFGRARQQGYSSVQI